jgi:hypothetical protein
MEKTSMVRPWERNPYNLWLRVSRSDLSYATDEANLPASDNLCQRWDAGSDVVHIHRFQGSV